MHVVDFVKLCLAMHAWALDVAYEQPGAVFITPAEKPGEYRKGMGTFAESEVQFRYFVETHGVDLFASLPDAVHFIIGDGFAQDQAWEQDYTMYPIQLAQVVDDVWRLLGMHKRKDMDLPPHLLEKPRGVGPSEVSARMVFELWQEVPGWYHHWQMRAPHPQKVPPPPGHRLTAHFLNGEDKTLNPDDVKEHWKLTQLDARLLAERYGKLKHRLTYQAASRHRIDHHLKVIGLVMPPSLKLTQEIIDADCTEEKTPEQNLSLIHI